jgi:hypothetical protein
VAAYTLIQLLGYDDRRAGGSPKVLDAALREGFGGFGLFHREYGSVRIVLALMEGESRCWCANRAPAFTAS